MKINSRVPQKVASESVRPFGQCTSVELVVLIGPIRYTAGAFNFRDGVRLLESAGLTHDRCPPPCVAHTSPFPSHFRASRNRTAAGNGRMTSPPLVYRDNKSNRTK
ncbi:hypothetical protein EVAR_54917_1 [Eumeta japonica]|uniref:Uncharacterized protein n=1 Tax=Eumeta variegata TaxID=151549 RepID=A0A4C1Z038_EUMVA|nr:hypothetical protein EVAR_54917_1 [Eumeta japonica]